MDEDALAEARRILQEAVGANDNGCEPAAGTPAVFHGPVTVNVTIVTGVPEAERQRVALIERVRGFVAAEGEGVATAFRELVVREFAVPSFDTLTGAQLNQLLGGFNKLLRAARLLSATPGCDGQDPGPSGTREPQTF